MAITATNLTSGASGTNQSSYTTASITPGANRLILAAVASQDTADTGAPTLSGNGLSWVQVASLVYSATGQSSRLSVFRAMGASPTTGAVTITPSSAATGCSWIIDEFDGVNTGGTNGSAAVVQSNTNSATATTAALAVTLSAFGDAANRPYAAFVDTRSSTNEITAEHTELAEATHTSPQNTLMTQWSSSVTDTSITGTPDGSVSVDIAGIAIELADAGFGGGGGGGNDSLIVIVMD